MDSSSSFRSIEETGNCSPTASTLSSLERKIEGPLLLDINPTSEERTLPDINDDDATLSAPSTATFDESESNIQFMSPIAAAAHNQMLGPVQQPRSEAPTSSIVRRRSCGPRTTRLQVQSQPAPHMIVDTHRSNVRGLNIDWNLFEIKHPDPGRGVNVLTWVPIRFSDPRNSNGRVQNPEGNNMISDRPGDSGSGRVQRSRGPPQIPHTPQLPALQKNISEPVISHRGRKPKKSIHAPDTEPWKVTKNNAVDLPDPAVPIIRGRRLKEAKFLCAYCPMKFCQEGMVRRHETMHVGSPDQLNYCQYPGCGIPFRHRASMKKHQKAVHESAVAVDQPIPEDVL
jgi:hypothetical protein